MSLRKANKPLSLKQLRLLIETKHYDCGKAFPNHSEHFLRAERLRARREIPPVELAEVEVSKQRDAERLRDLENLYKATVREVADLKQQMRAQESMPDVKPRDVRLRAQSTKREATAIVVASDWHCEERVTREATNGLNEFDLTIFSARANLFFRNVALLIRKEARAIPIKNCILALIGDFISGSIHADLAESNQLGPMDAIALVQDTIAGGIQYLLRALPPGMSMTIVLKPGNHSRITPRQRVQTEHENSLEWLMGHSLAQFFKDEKRVTFVRDRSLLTYVEVYGRPIRFTHGHAFNYAGGVGGITIPVNKKIAEWDKGRQAYLTVFGHLHTYLSGQRFISNGSMIGYSPFSEWIGAAYEPPVQAFALIDSKHGRTVQAPILLEED